MEEGRPVRAAHKRALDIGRAAGPCNEIDVAWGRRAPFGVGVVFKMRQDFVRSMMQTWCNGKNDSRVGDSGLE